MKTSFHPSCESFWSGCSGKLGLFWLVCIRRASGTCLSALCCAHTKEKFSGWFFLDHQFFQNITATPFRLISSPSFRGMSEVHSALLFYTVKLNFSVFRMSSAAALGQKWTFDEDLYKVNFYFQGLEKQSRPNRLRHNLLLDNGLPGLQVNSFGQHYLYQNFG